MLRKQRIEFRKKCWHLGIVRRRSPRSQFLDPLFDRVRLHDYLTLISRRLDANTTAAVVYGNVISGGECRPGG